MAHTPARPTAASGRSARRFATRSSHAAPKRRRPWNANGRSEAEPPFSIQAEIVDGVAVGKLALAPRNAEERIRACGPGDHVRLLPARGDGEVGRERRFERGPQRAFIVAVRRQSLDRRARSLELCREDQPVCLVDLTRGQRLARAAKLSSRSEHGGARPARAPNLRYPGGGQSPEPRGRERGTPLDDGLTGANVAPPRTDVGAVLNDACDLDVVVILDNTLDGDDGIRAVRHDSTGCDSHRFAGTQGDVGGLTGGNSA